MKQYLRDLKEAWVALPAALAAILNKKAKDLEAYNNHDYDRGWADGYRQAKKDLNVKAR